MARTPCCPPVRPGDLIGVASRCLRATASPVLFLSHGHPAEVLVLDSRAHLVRDRDTVADLLAKQHLCDEVPAQQVLAVLAAQAVSLFDQSNQQR